VKDARRWYSIAYAVRRQYRTGQDRAGQGRAILERNSGKETGQSNTTADTLYRTPEPRATSIHTSTMDDTPDVATLVAGLISSSESARKYAVFKLQGLLADPSFADAFIQGDGLPALHSCVLETSGNAQAYALGSLLVLLELDVGWEVVDGEVVEKVSCAEGTWSKTASQE
jgi:hypothetical protein